METAEAEFTEKMNETIQENTNEFTITLLEASKILDRSTKSIGRYVSQGRLTPNVIKSHVGAREYRFSRADLEAFRIADSSGARKTAEDVSDTSGKKGQEDKRTSFFSKKDSHKTNKASTGSVEDKKDNVVLVGALIEQLAAKDTQIAQLHERIRETNYLLGQNKTLLLGKPETQEATSRRQVIFTACLVIPVITYAILKILGILI